MLMAILTGGVFTAGAVGIDGITRNATPAAFDANGFLRPCALVKERGLIPDSMVADGLAQVASAGQTVEVWLYELVGYTAIDAALARLKHLFYGYSLTDSFPIEWTNTINRQRDTGALANASLARIDFYVLSVQEL